LRQHYGSLAGSATDGISMQAFVIRRLLALIPTLLFTSIIVFASIHMIPGDIIDLMLAQNDISTGQDRARIEAALGLDQPIHIQYFNWVWNAMQGDLGRSLWQNIPVTEQLAATLPITFELGLLALIVALTVAIPIGIYSAMRQDTAGDYISRSFSLLMLAIPSFWLGTLVMVFPSVWWRWAPPLEFVPFFEDPFGNLAHMLIPAILLGLSMSAVTMRMTRTMMLEVLRQDYIRTARAKGLGEHIVILRHALRNGLIPVITLIGLQAPLLIGGAVILEQIFVVPGMGLLLLEAVFQRDYPVVTGVFLVVGMAILVINLVVDLTYGFLDPKVRH
jgi:peptide/nickel transport system permease protein